MRKLTIVQGDKDDMGREFPLPDSGTFLIGRGLNTQTILHDKLVSGTHCRLEIEGDAVYLIDNKSSNGTFVAGENHQVTTLQPHVRHLLKGGNRIRLGKTTILEYTAPPPAVVESEETPHLQQTIHLGGTVIAKLPRLALPCHSCGKELFPRAQYAGFQVRCPFCRNMVMLPGRAAVAQPVSRR